MSTHRGQAQGWETLWNLAEQRHASGFEIEESRGEDARDHDQERDRPILEPDLPRDETRERRDPYQERRPVCLANMAEKVRRALPEIAVRTFEPKQLRQLRARELEREPGLEPNEHRLRKKPDRGASTKQPCRERSQCEEQRDGSRERRMPRRISTTQLTDGGTD